MAAARAADGLGGGVRNPDRPGEGRWRTPAALTEAGLVSLDLTGAALDLLAPLRDPHALDPAGQRALLRRLLFPAPPRDAILAWLAPLVRPADWEPVGDAQRVLPDDLARRVATDLSLGKSQREVAAGALPFLDGSRVRARRAARTLGIHTAHSAQVQAWQGLGDMLAGYTLHSVKGPHTRAWHARRDGRQYFLDPQPGQDGLEKCPHPPLEPDDPGERPPRSPKIAWNCLCYLTPILKTEEELRDESPASVQAPALVAPPAPTFATAPGASVRIASWADDAKTQDRADKVLLAGLKTAGPQHVQAAVGAPPGSVCTLNTYKNQLVINLKGPGYNATRSLRRVKGELVVKNDLIKVEQQGNGLGTQIFADQVAGLIKLGAARIEAEAAGEKDGPWNGYYTWPRLGYDCKIPAKYRRKLPADLADAQTLLELYALPGGGAWWKENGGFVKVTFDLKEGSRSRSVLAAYLRERGKAVPPELTEARGGPPPAGAEEPDLSSADHAALDRLWERIAREGWAAI